jgi:hypothetical protein
MPKEGKRERERLREKLKSFTVSSCVLCYAKGRKERERERS